MLRLENCLKRSIIKISMLFVLVFSVCSSDIIAGKFTDSKNIFPAEYNYSTLSNILMGDLAVGESKTKTIYANRKYNYTHIYLRKDKKYKFTVESPAWNNGEIITDAGGYNTTDNLRRHKDYKMMALVGEIFSENDNTANSYTGTHFLIGLGRSSYTVTKSGYLVGLANDCLLCYFDNSRVVTLTVKRLE